MQSGQSAARSVTRRAGLLVLALLVAWPALGFASGRRGRRMQPMADVEVRTMVSTTTPEHVLRAIVGVEEIYQYLVVERIRRGATEGDRSAVLDQERIDKLVVGGRTRSFPTAPEIRRLHWRGQVLHFIVSDGRKFWRCMVAAGPGASYLPRCDAVSKGEAAFDADEGPAAAQAGASSGPAAVIAAKNWGADAGVVKACGSAMTGAKNVNNCVKIAGRFKYDPRPTVAACAAVMSGANNTTACLMIAAKGTADRAQALRTCERAVSGSDNRANCFKVANKIAWEPSLSIAACGKAMTGARNVLSCLLTIKDAAASPHAAIASCAQTMSGAKNRLQCIKSAAGR